MYSSANNSAKGSTEVEPATVIPALDRWQPMIMEIATMNERIHGRQIFMKPSLMNAKCKELPFREAALWAGSFTLLFQLSISSCDVILRPLVFGSGEDISRRTVLQKFSQEKESRPIRGPSRLLHIVGDDDDGIVLF